MIIDKNHVYTQELSKHILCVGTAIQRICLDNTIIN